GSMEDFQASEETAFVVDEVSSIVKEAIESAIGGNAYQHSKVNQWTTNVLEQTLSQLTKLGRPFKYIVTCVIMQKNGAGLHSASSCFWDSSTDGSCTVRWENKTMYCIVSTFGLSIGGSRRGLSSLSLAKSVSTTNIAGHFNDESP
nr:Chain A, Dynein light chain Tctex-type 1,Rho guanine nucleotide exchange factor 2 [Mus musculus]5WI4_B Chain B, Dynein light chain Tctex-type 1,Rho guanine nucleotide exchange factor 2 [Mus musculus]5WI4_C Chain C, Dynein light chain Tctex-type 1,Rho guanine nucleotide exchange factor 2 [Mus musculus]